MYSANKGRECNAELSVFYHFHGILTDKKLLEMITPKEKRQLKKVRSILDYYEQDITTFYQNKITAYKNLLAKLEKIKQSI